MRAARQVSAWLVLLCLGATAALAQAESGLTQKEQLLMDAAYEGRMDLVEKLIPLAQGAKEIVDDIAKFPAWNQRDDIKAELKVELILLLAEHGYPPVANDEVYKEIFEQAENFKKYRTVGY